MRAFSLALLITACSALRAQPWAGILDPNRAIDWSTAGAISINGARTQCGSTLTPANASPPVPPNPFTDDGIVISKAIWACNATLASPKYVLLAPGTFYVQHGITFDEGTQAIKTPHSYITLRGSGPLATKIVFFGGDGCGGTYADICLNNSTQYSVGSTQTQSPGWTLNTLTNELGPPNIEGGSYTAMWTNGYTNGTQILTLSRIPSTLTTQQFLFLDQPNDEYPIRPTAENGVTEVGNVVTVRTMNPSNLNVGDSVYLDNTDFNNITTSTPIPPAPYGISQDQTTGRVTVHVSTPHTFVNGSTVCVFVNSAGYAGHWTVDTDPPNNTTLTYTPRDSAGNIIFNLANTGWGTVDHCYNNSPAGNPPYQVQSVAADQMSFTVPAMDPFPAHQPPHILTNLTASGQQLNSNGTWASRPATVSRDHTDGLFVCSTGGVCRSASGGQGTQGRLRNGMYRSQAQVVRVVNVDIPNNQVTIDPGLYAGNWGNRGKTKVNGRIPGVFWVGPQIQGVGIEDMTLDHTQSKDDAYHTGTTVHPTIVGIKITNAYDCWLKNVRSIYANQSHVRTIQSAHITQTSNYYYGMSHFSHTASYGLDEQMTADNLIVNNIFHHIASPMVLGLTTGSVFAFNTVIDPYTSSANFITASNLMHDAGDNYILWEANDGAGVKGDYFHGSHALNTMFRNRGAGMATNTYNGVNSSDSNQGTVPFFTQGPDGRYMNIIGNVLGDEYGNHITYESSIVTDPTAQFNLNQAIYALGWGSTSNNCSQTICDPLASSSIMRWGNYTTVTPSGNSQQGGPAATRWEPTEVPTSDPNYRNSVPANHNLPASFAFSAPPAFWTMAAPAAPSITTASLPAATVNVPYSVTLTATGGTGPGTYSWGTIFGALPAGMTLDPSTGVFSGTPTLSYTNTNSFTTMYFQVIDGNGVANSAELRLTVNPPPAPLSVTSPSTLTPGTEDLDYSIRITTTGGVLPLSFAKTTGVMPPGLSLNTQTGDIGGTPSSAGSYSFNIAVTDSSTPTPVTVTRFFTLVINPPVAPAGLNIITTTLQDGQVGVNYSDTVVASGGNPPYSWSVTGALPDGLVIDPNQGLIAGVPTTGQIATFTVNATDSDGVTDSQALTINILNLPGRKRGKFRGTFK